MIAVVSSESVTKMYTPATLLSSATGQIEQIEVQKVPRVVRWGFTAKGEDTLPILMGLIGFGSKWYPEVVFADRQPRTPEELFPKRVKFNSVIR